MSDHQPANFPRVFRGASSGRFHTENAEHRQITLWALLDALRRCWVRTLAVAIPAAVLTAALIWEVLPSEYRATAVLQAHQFEQVLARATDRGSADFETSRNSQMTFMKTHSVLEESLGRDRVSDCRTLATVDHPVDWLEKNLKIKADVSPEFVRISLSGKYPDNLTLNVNAVKDFYMGKVVCNERYERIESLRKLKQKFAKYDRNVRQNQDRIDSLVRELGTGNAVVAATNEVQYQMQLRGPQEELRQINAKIRNKITAQKYLWERGLTSTETPPFMPGPRNHLPKISNRQRIHRERTLVRS